MIRIPRVKNYCENTYVCWGCTEFAGDTENVNFKLLNSDFEVVINGEQCEVRECRVSAIPYNRAWPGKQRAFNQSESAGFISFSADEEVEIKVKRKKSFGTAMIRPLSKNVNVDVVGEEVRFKLKEHGQYVLEFGDSHNVLHIFFNEIKEYPNAESATMYFGPGMHFPGVITLRDNDTVYIDEEAVVFGSINSLGAKKVKIFGGGVIDNSTEERITEHCYENFTKGTFRIYNCENIDVSDIILTNSSTWAMSMFNCNNVHIDNVKIVGHWRYNTDGIDIVNSENVYINNCFIRTFDDAISIKAIYDHPKPIQNIIIDGCVMWTGWSKTCDIGLETAGVEYKNITYRNCDLIHNSGGAMCVNNGCYAEMHDILYENMNVEFQNDTMLQIIQREDDQEYDAKGATEPARLIRISTKPFATRRKNIDGPERVIYEKQGSIHDVLFKNINVYTEDEEVKPIILIETDNTDKEIKNISLEHIFINGKKADGFECFETSFFNVENVTII